MSAHNNYLSHVLLFARTPLQCQRRALHACALSKSFCLDSTCTRARCKSKCVFSSSDVSSYATRLHAAHSASCQTPSCAQLLRRESTTENSDGICNFSLATVLVNRQSISHSALPSLVCAQENVHILPQVPSARTDS